MAEEDVIKCISSMLSDGVLFVEELRSKIQVVQEYLKQLCRSLANLEEFLGNYDEDFIVENGRVAVYSSHLDSGREKAAEYFIAELKKDIEKYGRYPQCQNFRGHIGQAERDVIDYVNTFYPEEEKFEDFLLEYPEAFVVFDDDTVSLIETECVNYFKTFVKSRGIHVTRLQRLALCAPEHISRFIKKFYAGDDFWGFLENNSEIFYVENGYVYPN